MGRLERKRPVVILQCVFLFKLERKGKKKKKPGYKSCGLGLQDLMFGSRNSAVSVPEPSQTIAGGNHVSVSV